MRLLAAPRVVLAAQSALLRLGVDVAAGDDTPVVARLHPGEPSTCDLLVRAGDGRCTSAWIVVAAEPLPPDRLGSLLGARIVEFLRQGLIPPAAAR